MLTGSHPYTLQLPEFAGPLDVLLRLIERRQLVITSIAVAEVADQYLEHVRGLEAPDPAAVAEFLALAAQLLLIKSRALLPRPEPVVAAEEDPAEQLAQRLRDYQRFKQVAAGLRALEAAGRRLWERQAPPPRPVSGPPPLGPQSHLALVDALQRRLRMIAEAEAQPESIAIPKPKTITIAEVGTRLEARLGVQAYCTFEDLLDLEATRADIIVTVWTMLELFKRGVVSIEQEALFGAIVIGRGERFGAGSAVLALGPEGGPEADEQG